MLEQEPNSEQKDETQLPSSPNNSNTDVVRSPNFMSIENKIKEFEESKKNGYGRFVFGENGKVTGVEIVTLPDTNNVFIPTDNKV